MGVCGAYWMSSIRSFLNTTLPGVAARFSPTRNGRVSTWRGRPPLLQQVVDEVAGPGDQAGPAGLEHPLERGRVGEQEVRRRERVQQEAGRQLGLGVVDGVPGPGLEQVARPAASVARWACRTAKNAGLSVHVRSANRLSLVRDGHRRRRVRLPSQRAAATGASHRHAGPVAQGSGRHGGRVHRGTPQHRERGFAQPGRVDRAEHVGIRGQHLRRRFRGFPCRLVCRHVDDLPVFFV